MKTKPTYGNLPENLKSGTKVIIGKHHVELVRAGQDDYGSPCYRLRYKINLTGNQIFSVDELNSRGAQLNEI
jgi:hypothetical protein